MGNIRLLSLGNTVLHMFTVLVQPSKREACFLLMNKLISQHISKDRMGNYENLARCLPISISLNICLWVFLNGRCKPGCLATSENRQ